jgi:hypothetical protein
MIRRGRKVAIGRAAIAIFGLLAIAGQPAPSRGPSPTTRKGEHRIVFRARNGFVYIPARVNGNQATLLLDTGAALTTFNLKIVPTINSESRITINMAKGSVPACRVRRLQFRRGGWRHWTRCSEFLQNRDSRFPEFHSHFGGLVKLFLVCPTGVAWWSFSPEWARTPDVNAADYLSSWVRASKVLREGVPRKPCTPDGKLPCNHQ